MVQPIGSYGDSNSRSGFQDGGRDSSKGPKPGYGSTKSSFVDVRGQQAHADWLKSQDEKRTVAKSAAAATSKARSAPPTAPSMHPAVSANSRQFGTASQGLKAALGRVRAAKRLGSLLKRSK